MNIQGARILLTGAGGGIGRLLALNLARQGGRLVLVDRNPQALEETCNSVGAVGERPVAVGADLSNGVGRRAAGEEALKAMGTIDILINNAGVLHFNPFETEDLAKLELLMQVNTTAPMALTRMLLPAMLAQQRGRVVNIGSTFGSIGFPFFAAYSASKFAMRGFSQALRRELRGTGVGVTYIAPRATRTPFNSDAIYRMNEALKIGMDSPEHVADAVVRAINEDRDEVYLGGSERLFVRINALAPGIVDKALHKQQSDMRRFASDENTH